ncbi:unnamed protein product [Lupinus luteus]|uniref:BHLH domain-containing protein n=1 Tax=Lupinus luteus TaxID=3873 RepID=A0AAV1XZB2_LUPLU
MELLSSAPSEDVGMMMMQFPEFSAAYGQNDTVEVFAPPSELCGGAANSIRNNMSLADLINNPPMPWSSFTSPQSTSISFTNNPAQMLQQQEQTPPAMLYKSETANPYEKRNSMAAMREMIFGIASMQPIHIDPESVKPRKRKNVKISKDPQSVAARHRRERISEKIRILQRLVPGGTKMDTASMLDVAIHYVKFLKSQVQSLQRVSAISNTKPVLASGIGFPVAMNPLPKPYQSGNVKYYGDYA